MASRPAVASLVIATLAALAVPQAATADAGDSFCGPGLQYLVALRCGESGPVVLQCVPDALRGDICTLPNTAFGRAVCRVETGEAVEPTLVEAATGTSPRALPAPGQLPPLPRTKPRSHPHPNKH